jgi:hypothetical protein
MALKFDGKCLIESSKTLCNVKGDRIYEGVGTNKTLIKTSDAARKIGATSRGPLTAAIWYLFCK